MWRLITIVGEKSIRASPAALRIGNARLFGPEPIVDRVSVAVPTINHPSGPGMDLSVLTTVFAR